MAFKSKRQKELERAQEDSAISLLSDLGSNETVPKQINFTGGAIVPIVTNAYHIERSVTRKIYQYDVKLEPEILSDRLTRTYVYKAICGPDAGPMSENQMWKEIIYDGRKVIFSTIGDLAKEVEISPRADRPNDKGVKVIIKSTGEVDQGNSEALLQTFNVAFQNAYVKLGFEKYMRKWIDPNSGDEDSTTGFKFFTGFTPSITALSTGLSYVIDTTTKISRKQTLYDLLKQTYNPSARAQLEKAIKTLDISTTIGKQQNLKNLEIQWESFANQKTFERKEKDGRISSITIHDYYRQTYNYECKPDDYLVKVVKKQKSGNVELLYPSSTLKITGISEYDKSKNNRLMQTIGNHTRIEMSKRKEKLDNFVNRIANEPAAKEFLERWGFKLGAAKEIQGKIIPPPKLCFGNGSEQLNKETLGYRLRDHSLQKEPTLETNPLFITNEESRGLMENLVSSIVKVSRGLHFPVMDIKPIYIRSSHESEYRRTIITEINKGNIPSYVFCLLPDDKRDRYSSIKDLLTCKLGIPSQCVVARTLNKPKGIDSVATNLVAQIASKTGGMVCRVDDSSLKLGHTMIIGLSITQTRGSAPSLAGVATYDKHLAQDYSECETQNQSERVVNSDFCAHFIENAINAYQEANNEVPRRIVVYREGAAYGQMPEIKKKEVDPMQKYIEENCAQTSFTFIVCQKHGSLRIMAKAGSTVKNCVPGTVVTEGISVKDIAEFYLISHNANQGAATATRYTVMHSCPVDAWNDDHLITLTQYMTAIYPNWQGTIRIPAVLMLAGRLADQKRTHLSESPNPRLNRFLHFL